MLNILDIIIGFTMNNNDNLTGSSGASPAPPPSLPFDINSIYLGLDNKMQRLFIKVFKWLWGYVNGVASRSPLVFNYWAVDSVRRKYKLTSSELAVISFIYFVSNKGARCVRSEYLYNSGVLSHMLRHSAETLLNDLKHKKLIVRFTSDPSFPYLSRSYAKQPIFIKLSASGVKLIQTIDKDLYNMMLNTSLDDLTGRNKKGGYSCTTLV